MADVNFLETHFQKASISALEEIFTKTQKVIAQEEKERLKLELVSILRQETSDRMTIWEVSPSGENHIVFIDHICFFINIYGAMPILSSWLFFEGELDIKNIHWMEDDRLVLFDVYYIVHGKVEKCICHYSNNSDAFCYFTAARQMNGKQEDEL